MRAGQDGDLDLRRTGIGLVDTDIRNDLCFFFDCQCHACNSPPMIGRPTMVLDETAKSHIALGGIVEVSRVLQVNPRP